MEARYRELLELHRTKFVQLVEVERLYPILHGGSDGLTPADIAEINKHSSREDKVEKLLSLLPSKGNLAFQSLCLALETTYPHLLTVMFLGSSQRLAPDQRSTMSDSEEDSVRRPILQDSSSQEFRDHWKPGAVISTVQFEPHLENFHATADHHNQSSTKDIQSSFSRFSKDSLKPEQSKNYEWLRSQCEHAINELQSMKQQYAETMKRCDQAVKEAEHYRGQNKSLLSKLSKISEDKKMVESQNNEFSSIKQRLEHEIVRLQELREEDKQEMEEMRKQQRKVVNSSGSNEVLNEMYDTAMQRYDTLKRDYDALRERCEQTSATEITTENQMEIMTEENLRLKKRCDELSMENSTILSESDGIKQQCTSAIRNWNKALHENKALKEAQLMAQKQRDDLLVEIHQSLAKQIGMKKEVENIIHDRDNSRKEYQLVMSERDVVHKEIEQLHEKLKIASQKVELLEKNKRETENEVETLRREIRSALQERDKANKERNDICGRKQELEHERDEFWKEFDSMARERDIAKKERHEALEHIDIIIKETYEKSQKEKAEEINNASKETEILRKQMEKMKQDLSDSFSEADIAKKRRDWAFSERDKIVQERESIRTLCDNLRRDRDRAVSALAQALRDSDEIKKQKNEAFKELKDVKERFEVIVEKETRKTQLNSIGHNHSRDSAIDADLQEWEMETLDIDLQSVEGEEIGVELTGGKDDPQFTNDTSVYVSHITKGSIADGKLKVNDTVLKVNNIDVSNIEKRVAVRAIHKSTGRLNMVVRRRKSTSARIWQPLQLLLSCQKECGIHIEQGLFICGVYTGGIIAKDGMLPSVGDRIIHINGKSADSLTAREAMKLLEKSTEPVQLDVRRQVSPVSSAGSSPTPISQSVISSLSEQPASKMSKSESLPSHGSHWDTSLDGIQGTGSKILRSSGSQTDSLDSIGPVRRHKERNPDTEKSRHSVHVIGKAFEKIFRPRNHAHDKNSDGEEKTHKKVNSKGRNENVIAEFGPVYEKEEGKEIKRKRSHEGEQESNSGTWPKTRGQHMINMSGAATVIMPQKRTKERPSIKNIQFDPIPDHSMPNDLQNTSMSSDVSVSKYQTMPWDFEELPPYIPVSSLPPPTNIVNTKDKPYIPYGTFSNNHYSKNLSTHPSSDLYNLPSYADKPARLRPSSGTHKNNPQNRHSALPSHHSNGHHIREFRPVSAEVTSPKRIADIPSDKLSASTNFVENSIPSHSNRMVGRPNSFQHTSASTHSQSVWCNNVSTSPTTSGYYRPSHHIISPRSDFDLEKLPFNFDRLSTPSPSQHSSINLDRTTPTPSDDMFPKAHSISPYGGRPLSEIDFNTSYPTFHKRPLALERIRIPSNTSVATKSGSVEIVSDRSSASSPLFVFPHEDYSRSRKPQLREIRTIHIEKSAEPVGFQIQRGPEGGIFVSSVGENSLASDAGIVVGDQLLEVCGINMRNATYEHAVTVLRQCGNNLTMKVDFNPDKYRDHPESSSNGSLSSVPNSSGFSSPLSDNENSPKTRHTTSSHNRRKKSSFGSVDSAYERLRRVTIERGNGESPGFTIVGGNATGIFVHEIENDSIPDPPQGLQQGDHILEYNSVDFRSVTAEQASAELTRPCCVLRLLVHYNLIKYNKILNVPGDSFYIRANFERIGEVETELTFHKDDILLVENTLYQGNVGLWFAWLVDNEAKRICGGTIPSRIRLEDDISLRRSLSENFSLHDADGSRRGSGSARRSFFRRRRHHRNNSKDSREFNSFSDASLNSDSVPILDDSVFGYTKIEKQESNMVRPVVLLAPLSDAIIQKLIAESPDKYCQCQPVLMHSSAMSMEQNLSLGHYIDYWKREDQYECIRVSDIKDICDKKIHCLLNVGPGAIERLQRLKIYPIVVFVQHKNPKQIREVRDVQFLPEKMTTKLAKELFDQHQKLEQDFQHLFSTVIQGGNLAHMCMLLKSVIAAEQKKAIWVTAGSV